MRHRWFGQRLKTKADLISPEVNSSAGFKEEEEGGISLGLRLVRSSSPTEASTGGTHTYF